MPSGSTTTCSSRTSRRAVLKRGASAGLVPLIGNVNNTSPTLSVGLYASDSVADAQELNYAARVVGGVLSDTLATDVSVGPERVVESVPSGTGLQYTAEWWARNNDTDHDAAVLFVPYEDRMENTGYANEYGEPACVVSLYTPPRSAYTTWITLHEIGHALGATHNDASTATIMNHLWRNVDPRNLRYSKQSAAQMRP